MQKKTEKYSPATLSFENGHLLYLRAIFCSKLKLIRVDILIRYCLYLRTHSINCYLCRIKQIQNGMYRTVYVGTTKSFMSRLPCTEFTQTENCLASGFITRLYSNMYIAFLAPSNSRSSYTTFLLIGKILHSYSKCQIE